MMHSKINKYFIASYVFLIFSYTSLPVIASQQGSIDTRDSATVQLSVTVPHKIGLFVDKINNEDLSSQNIICLRIIDTRHIDGLHNYRIKGLDGNKPRELTLRSYSKIQDINKSECGNADMFSFRMPGQSNPDHILLLTLVPE